eukprot:4139415-Pleurochrysis_carterae.AAC.1
MKLWVKLRTVLEALIKSFPRNIAEFRACGAQASATRLASCKSATSSLRSPSSEAAAELRSPAHKTDETLFISFQTLWRHQRGAMPEIRPPHRGAFCPAFCRPLESVHRLHSTPALSKLVTLLKADCSSCPIETEHE